MGAREFLSAVFGGGAPKLDRAGAGDQVLVFVHGLGSTARRTWLPIFNLCKQDPAFDQVTLACYEYPTVKIRVPLRKQVLGLLDLAQGLRTELETRYSGREVMLVAHSLGGLVARQYLLTELANSRRPLAKRALLYAVPNQGAELAQYGAAVSTNHRQLEILRIDDEVLRRMNDDWIRLEIDSHVAVRHVVAGLDGIVTSLSARPVGGGIDYDFLAGYNHVDVVKPAEPDDIRYKVLRSFFDRDDKSREPATASPVHIAADPLFDVYSRVHESYYVERDFDDRIRAVLSASHIWVEGASGAGKTAALTRCLASFGWKTVHIMLSSYRDRDAVGLLGAMCVEMADLCEDAALRVEGDVGQLIAAFRRQARAFPDRVLGILVEEIPLPAGPEYDHFVELMFDLAKALEADPGTKGRVMLAFSSVAAVVSEGSTSPKLRERIVPLQLGWWERKDLTRLANLLAAAIRPNLSIEDCEQIAAAADGSPRFVKSVFRRWRNGSAEEMTLPKLLEAVRAEFIS